MHGPARLNPYRVIFRDEREGRGEAFRQRHDHRAPKSRPSMQAGMPLTVGMNPMIRCIGLGDFYSRVLPDTISAKPEFIHGLVHGRG
ncbi:hypothetical protein [uncultured Hoeflea sp.]|uniref:hypothetical protein n=1 Tax=uncultured Hoeflea sp. TaxID=538666 RepID=UPI0026222ABE|nr:hypothetical protein [uncultured Hoeflea sp.]